jgi:hypothetical protein
MTLIALTESLRYQALSISIDTELVLKQYMAWYSIESQAPGGTHWPPELPRSRITSFQDSRSVSMSTISSKLTLAMMMET